MIYVLDTDVSVEYLRGNKEVVEKVLGISDLFLTHVTIAELFYGVYKSQRTEEQKKKLLEFLEGVYLLGIDSGVCEIFGRIKADISKKGRTSGDFDILIASICIANNGCLITRNSKHYREIEGIRIETI